MFRCERIGRISDEMSGRLRVHAVDIAPEDD